MAEEDPLDTILTHRRIPYSYSKRWHGGGGSGAGTFSSDGKPSQSHGFDPLRACAVYEVRCKSLDQMLSSIAPVNDKTSKAGGGVAADARDAQNSTAGVSGKEERRRPKKSLKKCEVKQIPSMVLEVHGLNSDGDALICSLSAGSIMVGMGFLVGSQAGLEKVIRRADGLEDGNDDDKSQDVEKDDGRTDEGDESDHSSRDGDGSEEEERDDGQDEDDEDDEGHTESTEDRANASNFVKNSFRSPKFWFRWRARLSTSTRDHEQHTNSIGEHQQGSGYIVFSGNDCFKFSGTLNCESLDLDEASMKGKRVKSRARAECPMSWDDFKMS